MNAPLDVLLAALPSLPRPVLSRLVSRVIERLDEIDGDPDIEEDDAPEDDDPDFCLAGDDGVFSGAAIRANYGGFSDRPSPYQLGMDDDMESMSWTTVGAQSDVNQ